MTALPLLPGKIDWPGIQQVFRLERKFTFLRQVRVVRVAEAVHYGLTSLTRPRTKAERLLTLTRLSW